MNDAGNSKYGDDDEKRKVKVRSEEKSHSARFALLSCYDAERPWNLSTADDVPKNQKQCWKLNLKKH